VVPTCLHLPALRSFPTRRSSDLSGNRRKQQCSDAACCWARRRRRSRGPLSVAPMFVDVGFLRTGKLEVDEAGMEPVRTKHTPDRSEEHTSELQSRFDLVCRLLLE